MTAYDLDAIKLSEWTTNAVIVAPIIIGIVQAIKLTALPEKYAPLISILVGVLFAFMTGQGMFWGNNALAGVIYGLTASGLYSGVKTTIKDTVEHHKK